jgi:hypothetical protein
MLPWESSIGYFKVDRGRLRLATEGIQLSLDISTRIVRAEILLTLMSLLVQRIVYFKILL